MTIEKLAGRALDNAVSETWTVMEFEQLSRFQNEFAKLLIDDAAVYIQNLVDMRVPASEYSARLKSRYREEV